MASKKLPEGVHAFARAEYDRSSTFGHINIHVHELFGYSGPTLKITCQSGGEFRKPDELYTYAHQCGLSADYSLIKGEALKTGYYLLKRIDDRLAKAQAEFGREKDFADYAVRVLAAIGVRKVHVLEPVNGQMSYRTKIEELPTFSAIEDRLELRKTFERMEAALLAMRAW